MKKFTVMFLICLCFTSTILSAGEVQSSITKEDPGSGSKYVVISQTDCGLSINSRGKATVITAATCSPSVYKTTVEAHLMRYKDGKWEEYREWTETEYGYVATIALSYYVPSGYKYKLVGEIYAHDKSGRQLDHVTKVTDEVKY